jgi:cell fate (sporulation/competence/biofilm development) regulator YmcA (YheA/YmcA/DUF963 family)
MDKTIKFQRELIHFDEIGYNQAMGQAEKQLDALENCRMEAMKYCEVGDLRAFEKDMVAYVKNAIIDANKRLKDLQLPEEKVLMLLDIDLSVLSELSKTYYSLSEKIEWNKDVPFVKVDKAAFQTFTQNEEQNKKWRKVKAFMDAVHDLQKAYPANVRIGAFQIATNNLCVGNIRSNKLQVNPSFIFNS